MDEDLFILKKTRMFVHKYVNKRGPATIRSAKRSAGVVPKANLRNPLHVSDNACKWGYQNKGISFHLKHPLSLKRMTALHILRITTPHWNCIDFVLRMISGDPPCSHFWREIDNRFSHPSGQLKDNSSLTWFVVTMSLSLQLIMSWVPAAAVHQTIFFGYIVRMSTCLSQGASHLWKIKLWI